MRPRLLTNALTTVTLTFGIGIPVIAATDAVLPDENAVPDQDHSRDIGDPVTTLYEQQIRIYQDQIAAQESLYDTYNPLIGETLNGMANVQLKLGHYREAIRSYRRAMHIQRVNNGIYSLGQEPMIRGLATAYEALDDIENANLNHDQLLSIYARHYQQNSPELLALLKEQGEWHIRAYANSPGREKLFHLGNAHRLMMHAVHMASADTPAGTVTIVPLWRNLAAANFLLAEYGRRYSLLREERPQFSVYGTRPEVLEVEQLSEDELLVKNSYRSGEEALENIAAFHRDNPESTPDQRALALAELGDWRLIFGKYRDASDAYSEAWQATGGDAALQQRLFGQPRLISLLDSTEETEKNAQENPFIVANLSITNRGKPAAIEIVESHPEVDEDLTKTAYRVLKKARFRPRLEEGAMADSSDFIYRLEVVQ